MTASNKQIKPSSEAIPNPFDGDQLNRKSADGSYDT